MVGPPLGQIAGADEGIGGGVVELGRSQGEVLFCPFFSGAETPHHEHSTVAEQGGRVLEARGTHLGRGRPGIGCGVVDLGGGHRADGLASAGGLIGLQGAATRGQHPSVGKEGEGVT